MKKKWKKILPLAVMGMMLFSCAQGTSFAAGTAESAGTVSRAADAADVSWYDSSKTEFTITTPGQLKGLAEIVNGYTSEGEEHAADKLTGKTVRLGNDIDMTGVSMDAIGTSSSGAFQGTFDGNGHRITNYSLSSSDTYTRTAFFGYTKNAVIKNVSLQGTVTATGGSTYAAGIVGDANNTAISGCSFSGSATSEKSVAAGIVAYLNGGSVSDCENQAAVQSGGTSAYSDKAGGIAGTIYGKGKVSACTNTGTVAAKTGYAGGIAGTGSSSGKIEYCVNTGTVTSGGANKAAGIIGQNEHVDSCVTTTDKVYASNSSSYKCTNTFCIAEGTSTINGVTYITATGLTDGTLLAQLNAGGCPVWKAGTEHPAVNKGAVADLYMTLDGKARQYTAEQTESGFAVTVPADADLNALTADNFHASPLIDGAVCSYQSDDKSTGAWKLTGTCGTDTAEYTVQVNRSTEAWTPEISTDLAGRTDIYYTENLSSVKTLTVAADIYDKGTLSYQWYENTSKSTEGGTPIEGAVEASYTPVVRKDGKTAFGTKYYYAVITNTLTIGGETKTASVTSKVQTVKVQYTVTYTDAAVTANNRTEHVDFGGTPTPRALTRAGYTFKGWCGTEEYDPDKVWTEASVLSDDITLYACWEAIHYTIQLPESTADYTVAAKDASVEYVLYDGDYSFTVTPANASAFVLVKANGVRIKGVNHEYKITDIHENQVVTVEYTEGVEPAEDGSYTVNSEAELLNALEKAGEAPVIRLGADVSITSGTMNATQDDAFQGVFDGQGHAVTGLRGPLFGWVGENGVVKNLKVSGTLDVYANIIHYGDSVNVGGQGGVCNTCPDFLAPVAAVNYGTISRCISDAEVDSTDFNTGQGWGANDTPGLGGIAGQNFGTIEYCVFKGKIASGSKFGGYGGDSYGGIASGSDGVIRYCFNLGSVEGGAAAGIAGRINDYNETPDAVVENCYNAGQISCGSGMLGGDVVGYTNYYYRTEKKECQAGIRNCYFLSTSRNKGFDGSGYTDDGKTVKVTEDQLKCTESLEILSLLNQDSETSIFIKDLNNGNDGYPIFTWQGTPKMNNDAAAVSFTGVAQAETDLTADVQTELAYTLEWLLCDENGFTVITVQDENGDEVPFRENVLPVDNAYVGKTIKARLTSTEDGSSIVSEAQGPVLPAPIKSISFENQEAAAPVDLIRNEINTEENGTLTLSVVTDPVTSDSLLDGEAITWSSSTEGVVSIEPNAEAYDSAQETPALAVITAAGEGTTQVSVTIGEFTASAEIRVHPAYVEASLRMGDAQAPAKTAAGAKDLAAIYGETLAGTPVYVTPLHMLTSYVSDVLEKVPAEYITITDGKVTAIGGETGEWICLVNGRSVGSIDTSTELPKDAEVMFFKKDGVTDKIASFDQASYTQLYGAELTVTVRAVGLEGEAGAQPLAGAEVIVKKDGTVREDLKAVTDEEGNAVLNLPETGVYELTASHLNAEGADDIAAPYAKVTVADKIPVEDIEVSTEEKTLEAGSIYVLQASVLPENASLPGVVFSSDNEDVAEVAQDGTVTAKAQGTANITVASADDAKISRIVKITVVRSVTEIRLVQEEATIKVGETFQIEASVVPEDATNGALTYISNKTSVADVDENGRITAKSIGETTIEIVTEDGSDIRRVFTVNVITNVVPVEKVTLNASEKSMKVGETWQITAIVTPEDATDKGVTYVSSNTAVASVSGTGLLTALGTGETVITAAAADGSGAMAELKVTVQKNAEIPQTPQNPQNGLTIAEGQIYDSGDYRYKVTSTAKRTAEVVGLNDTGIAKIVINNSVKLGGKDYTVTSIAANAFKGNQKITSVVIKKNVETIGKNAFANCRKLKKITIKSTKLKTIQGKAFSGCGKLKTIVIKSKVLKKVGKGTFKGIHKKAVIKVPSAKWKAYTKLLTKKGQSKTVKIKK